MVTDLTFGPDTETVDPATEFRREVRALIQQETESLTPVVGTEAAQERALDASALFPEDEYADVPPIGDLWGTMVEQKEPFDILNIAPRTSDKGPMFRVVIAVGQPPDETRFSAVFSYRPEYVSRNERIAKIIAALEAGAPRIGPFYFTESEGQNGNNGFKSFVAMKARKPGGKK